MWHELVRSVTGCGDMCTARCCMGGSAYHAAWPCQYHHAQCHSAQPSWICWMGRVRRKYCIKVKVYLYSARHTIIQYCKSCVIMPVIYSCRCVSVCEIGGSRNVVFTLSALQSVPCLWNIFSSQATVRRLPTSYSCLWAQINSSLLTGIVRSNVFLYLSLRRFV